VGFPKDTVALPDEPAASASKGRIVLIDDDAIIRMLGSGLLRSAGYEVDVHPDGEPALASIQAGTPVDLVITDWMMPKVGGAEVLRALRASPATKSIPVIVLTGSLDAPLSDALTEAGASACLGKPIKRVELIETVQALLENRRPA
jgi:two-component system, OmpR family, phosphate regulon response regulator PhoB